MKKKEKQAVVLKYACVSHKGNVRGTNQDNVVWDGRYIPAGSEGLPAPAFGETQVRQPLLFGVFDGMGGEQRGEAASLIAAETAAGWPLSAGRDSLDALCRAINKKICAYIKEERLNTCGTTAAMIALDETGAVCCNVGDSRIYLLRDEVLEQVSEDHVLPDYRDGKSPLLQFLGLPETETTLEPAFFTRPAQDGDRYLICSDGLTDMLREHDIRSVMLSGQPLEDQAARLLDAVLAAGGKDNVSFILLHLNITKRDKGPRFLCQAFDLFIRRIQACTKIFGKS